VWELITDVPKIKKVYAIIIFVLNMIIPGSGTMLMSLFLAKCSKTLFFVGLFQLLLAYVLIGYVISIYWGYLVVKKALDDSADL